MYLTSRGLTDSNIVSFQGCLHSITASEDTDIISPEQRPGLPTAHPVRFGVPEFKVPLPGGTPLSVLTFLWAHLYHPYGAWGQELPQILLRAVCWVIELAAPDWGVSWLLPATVKPRQANFLACRQDDTSDPSLFLVKFFLKKERKVGESSCPLALLLSSCLEVSAASIWEPWGDKHENKGQHAKDGIAER